MNSETVGTIPDDKTIRLYLLDKLSDDAQIKLEEGYFDNYGVFERVKAIEADLMEEYARQELAGKRLDWFEAFEAQYLDTPAGQEKVAFAKDLVTLSQNYLTTQTLSLEPEHPVETAPLIAARVPWWKALFGRAAAQKDDHSQRRMSFFPVFATAAALLFLVLGGLLFLQNQKLQHQLADYQAKRTELEQRERQLQQQLSEQSGKSETLNVELERVRQELAQLKTVTPKMESAPKPEEEPLIATLTLGGNDRSNQARDLTTKTSPFLIPLQTKRVQIQIAIDPAEYKSYQVIIKAVTRDKIILNQSGLKRQGTGLTVSLPASKFTARDYFLTIIGTKPTGETEDVNKYALEIQKK